MGQYVFNPNERRAPRFNLMDKSPQTRDGRIQRPDGDRDEILGLDKYDSRRFFDGSVAQAMMAPTLSPNIVISQVYGGGGLASAGFTHDYIELFNRGTSPVNVNGWSVQYAGATANSWSDLTALPNVTIQPGQYFLIQQGFTGALGGGLPTPDLIANPAINVAYTGKVALVSNTTTLVGSCPTGGAIVDFVGYGMFPVNCAEGIRAQFDGTSTQSITRASGGCTENDLNRTDFLLAAAVPRNTASPTFACVSPTTGGRIAFVSDREGSPDIFVMNANGSNQVRLTNDPGIDDFPNFSANGSKIVFTRDQRVFSMDVDGSNQVGLTVSSSESEPKFSPDGSKIVFTSNRDGNLEIYVMDANGDNQTRLTNNTAWDFSPVFSPDGQKIAFTSERDGQFEVYIMDANGSNQVRLTFSPGSGSAARDSLNPSFSPDGSRIAFESTRAGNKGRIFIMDTNGSNQTQVTFSSPSSLDVNDLAPSFSPDGSAIAFYTDRHGGTNYEVYTMNLNGSNQTNRSSFPNFNDVSPSWGVVAGALNVINVDSPGGSGAFGVGAVIPITVSFGAPVVVTGTPTLRLASVAGGFPVNYSSGSNTAVLTFNYTVQAGHASPDLDYTSTAALVLNGGTINSFGGTPANLTLPAPGAPGSLGANRNIIIDTTAPETTLLTGPSGAVNSTTAQFTFSSNEPGTFQCSLNSAAFTDCVSGITYNGLAQGPHTFEVRARDVAANFDPTPASRTWTVDTVAPETTINSGPSGPTPSNSATFSFSSNEAGATFQCSLNGAAFSGCTSPVTYNDLTEGAKTFEVRATDAAGNQDATPAARSWTVDTIAPNTTITGGPTGTVNSTLANFTFTSNEAGATFECSLDGAAFAPCTSPAIYGGLAQGPHTFAVRAVDAAGNVDATPDTREWTADTVAPQTTIDNGPNGSVSNTSATFHFSSNEAGSTFQCQIDGGGFSACTSPTTYNGLSQGSHNFQVRATDIAGNTDLTPAVRTWTVDTIAPDTFIDSGPSGFVSSTSATFHFSSNETGVTFLCSINGGIYSLCTSPATYNGLVDGERSFGVRAIDAAGNQDGSPALRSWTIDTVDPETTIHTGPTGTVASTSATFQFSSNEGGATFECSLDGGAFATCSSPREYNGLAQGPHTFEVRAIDQAGNVDKTPASRSWTVNTNVTISGNVKQAPGMTNLSGVTVTLSGCANAATATDGAGNYSFAGTYAGACTVTPSGLGKFYDAISRTFNVAGNVGNVDFTAYDTLAAAPRKLRVVNDYVVPGQTAVVSIILNSQGNERSVAFSVDYDEALFVGSPTVACGADAGVGCGLTVVNGSVGITVIPQGGGTFAAGDREVVRLTFQTQATSAHNALLDLTGSPTNILINNSANDPLLVEMVDGHIVYQQGLEGDLGGRPTGDGIIFSNDVIIARQFASFITTANPAYNEFQRVDTAPAATKGDGIMSAGDVIQARRYASGADTPTAAGGPFEPAPPAPPPADLMMVETQRSVRVASRTAAAGQKATVPIEMKAMGDELAIRFTLEYDGMKLSNPVVVLAGVAPADAVVTVNDKETGRLTVLIDAGTAFLSTDGPLVNVTFDIAPSAAAGGSMISFADNGSIADAGANEMPAIYTAAALSISGAGSPEVGVSGRVLSPAGIGVRSAQVTLVGPDGYLRTVTTSTLGYYSFDGVPAGPTYRIGVNSRRYRFESRTIEISAELADLDFVGLE